MSTILFMIFLLKLGCNHNPKPLEVTNYGTLTHKISCIRKTSWEKDLTLMEAKQFKLGLMAKNNFIKHLQVDNAKV